jgi:hypothetical protein
VVAVFFIPAVIVVLVAFVIVVFAIFAVVADVVVMLSCCHVREEESGGSIQELEQQVLRQAACSPGIHP